MIRRIIGGLFLIYLSLWLGAAYLIEREITKLNKLGLEFSDIKISGFPKAWKFELIDPILQIQSSSETQSFSSKSIIVAIDFSFKTIKFKPQGEMLVEYTSEGQPELYQIDFDSPAHLAIKFAKPIIFAKNDLWRNVSGLIFNSDNLYVSSDGEELFLAEDTALYLKYLKSEDGDDLLYLDANLSYTGRDDILGFNMLKLALSGQVESSVDLESKKILLKNLDIDNLDIIINEDAYLGLYGQLTLPKDEMPFGKFDLELQNYPDLVDFLWLPRFEMTSKEVKDIIAEAARDQEVGDLILPIVFSDSGITINGKNLKDLKGVE